MCPSNPKVGDEGGYIILNEFLDVYIFNISSVTVVIFYAQIVLSLVVESPSSWFLFQYFGFV